MANSQQNGVNALKIKNYPNIYTENVKVNTVCVKVNTICAKLTQCV